ncbi:DUF2293 domain-containing protein [Oricola cellulosilytica]|uniref:DUF2293 domain-containing protein n=1 Tax=Oricola cellulosilytica TaxID=1429082 RepID=A0A4R0PAS8_9HYPH|nr:DUF2293 domain-containing protein [Oricola cellulosilytica]TCD14340.1 DUF2293 domain-containing protein [Oricola cellulosilytica]
MTTKRQVEAAKSLRALAPMIPFNEALEVKALAAGRHLRRLPVSVAMWLSLVAHIRHVHTDYDSLLEEGYDRDAARHFVVDDINSVLARWQATRRVEIDDSEAMGAFPDPVEDS